MLLIKAFSKEQPSVIHFLSAKGLSISAIHSEVSIVWWHLFKLQDYQYVFGVRNLLTVEKMLPRRNHLAAASILFCTSIQKLIDGINIWMNLDSMLIKWRNNVWCLKGLLVELVHFSCISQCCLTFGKLRKKTDGQNTAQTDLVLSTCSITIMTSS